MTHKIQTIFGSQIIALTIIFATCVIAVSSCTKKSDSGGSDAAKFVGTWNGTTTCSSSPISFTLVAGSSASSLTLGGTVGNTGCVVSTTVNITAGGNNLTIPSQTFTDGCGLSYTISGSGSLSGSTLTLTESVSGAVTATCTSSGTK